MKILSKKDKSSDSSSSRPFLKKRGAGTFFSNSKEMDSPFFTPASIQTKLKIGEPGDKYEREADSIAEKVVQKIDSSNATSLVQNKCYDCTNEQKLKKNENLRINKNINFENESSIKDKYIYRSGIEGISQNLETQLHRSKGKGQPLDRRTKHKMEQSFNTDFTNVKVHTNNHATQMNQQLGAQAFANGNDIYFNQGKYSPGTKSGSRLLAHELTHVIQQSKQNNSMLMRSCSCDSFSSFPSVHEVENGERNFFETYFPLLDLEDVCVLEGSASSADYEDQEIIVDPLRRNQPYRCYGWTVGDTEGRIDEEYIVERYAGRRYEGEDSITMDDLQTFYGQHGFSLSGSGFLNAADILVYGTGGIPGHVALRSSQQCGGEYMFTSKLGIGGPLIAHLPRQLEGGDYGNIIGWFSRRSSEYHQYRVESLEEAQTRRGRRRSSRRPPSR